jgi:hypothetical protein
MDAESSESVVHTSYALISGRAGEPRDWDRWKKLYAPGARLIPIEASGGGSRRPNVLTADEYIASRSPFLAKQNFYEYETEREELRCGQLVHVWSTYEASEEPNGKVIRKGVNSIQLWDDGTRYWILSIAWDAVEALNAIS